MADYIWRKGGSMRLRNKKTGQEGNFIINKDHFECVDLDCVPLYFSLSELLDEWEDYEPKEPLIKDEKIRKAVRAWAEANGIGGCICKEEIHCITFETERGMFISFEDADPIPPEGNYTIDELCGEEE